MNDKRLLRRLIAISTARAVGKIMQRTIPWIIVLWAVSIACQTMTTIYFINHPVR